MWLYSKAYDTHHISIKDRRKEGTGNWLFEGAVFQGWKSGKTPVLWAHGIRMRILSLPSFKGYTKLQDSTAGAGKTFLRYVLRIIDIVRVLMTIVVQL